MIIFLAAVLDVPAAPLRVGRARRRRARCQRLRWVTLPTISPVILFAVVLGVIQGLQYFTQAYVAANVAAGQASQAGDGRARSSSATREGSTLFYPVLLYYHGFRFFNMGYASAMAMLLLVGRVRRDARDHPQLAALGALRGRAVSRERRRRRSDAGRSPPAAAARSAGGASWSRSPTTAC